MGGGDFNPISSMFLINSLSSLNSQDDKNSNNWYVKYLIFLLIFYQIFENFIPYQVIRNKLCNYFLLNNYIKINIPSVELPITNYTSGKTTMYKTVYSKSFLAIMHYIMMGKCEISSLTEVMVNNCETSWRRSHNNDDEDDKTNNWYSNDQFVYFPLSDKEFLIYDNIYCIFNSETINNPNEQGKSVSSDAQRRKDYLITLYIKTNDMKAIKKIEKFINDCIETYNEYISAKYDKSIQYIFEYTGFEKAEKDDKLTVKYKEFEMKHNKDLTTNIFFDGKDRLISYINDFVYDPKLENTISEGEAKYIKCGFTFKAGLLFYGSPGCGKTSTIKAILKYTKRHGIIVKLNKIKTCQELETVFRNNIINNKKLSGKQICFILEDCDAFEDNILISRDEKSKNKSSIDYLKKINPKNEKDTDNSINDIASKIIDMNMTAMVSSTLKLDDELNLSCFLNVLDGIVELYGVMIIMTTNYPEKIDSALIRPGRFDFKYEFKKMTRANIVEMLKFKFDIQKDDWEKRYNKYLKISDYTLSPAEVQSICFKNSSVIECINEIIITAQK